MVKIYPYSGSIQGRPSILRLPASQFRTTTSRAWHLSIPRIEANSVQLVWTEPWYGAAVEGTCACFSVFSNQTVLILGSSIEKKRLFCGTCKKISFIKSTNSVLYPFIVSLY